jgi:hypothetical protein
MASQSDSLCFYASFVMVQESVCCQVKSPLFLSRTLFVYASSVCDFNPYPWCLSTLGLMIKLLKGFPFAGTERNGVVVK